MDSSAPQTLPQPAIIGIIAAAGVGGPITAYDLNQHHKRGCISPP